MYIYLCIYIYYVYIYVKPCIKYDITFQHPHIFVLITVGFTFCSREALVE
jgi:hypothetical protein